jgi:hypothetical protein
MYFFLPPKILILGLKISLLGNEAGFSSEPNLDHPNVTKDVRRYPIEQALGMPIGQFNSF